MPISFSVANHQANPVQLTRQQRDGLTAMEILSMSSADTYKGVTEVLQSSLCSEASDAAVESVQCVNIGYIAIYELAELRLTQAVVGGI
jgi:hypothetical protein